MNNQLSKQTKPKVLIASDHGGFELKNKIVEYLKKHEYELTDYGNDEYDAKDDYTDFVVPMAMNMQKDLDNSKGVVLCRNGVGVNVAVNKFKGIRSGLCFNVRHVLSAIKDDNINVLALPADYISQDEAFDIVKEFLTSEFPKEERHIRRLEKIKDLGM